MQVLDFINTALSRKTTTACVWLLACLLLFAAHVHIANMLGWNGRPWMQFPFLWKLMDVFLLAFEVSVAMGLIFRKSMAVLAFFAGMLVLQIIPFTIFRSHFVTKPADENMLNSLLTVEICLMLVLLILVVIQGRASEAVNEIRTE